jgi:hypothetical protein
MIKKERYTPTKVVGKESKALRKGRLTKHGGEIPLFCQVSDTYVYIVIPPVLKQIGVLVPYTFHCGKLII